MSHNLVTCNLLYRNSSI